MTVSRKRQEKFISIKINPAHAQLQERVAYLRAFRRSHEQLRVMTSSTRGFSGLGGDGPLEIDMDEEVRLSYESVKNVDVLDVTPGTPGRDIRAISLIGRGRRDLVHRGDRLQ